MSSDNRISRSFKKLLTVNLRKSITLQQDLLAKISSKQIKYDMNDLKMIMLLGLIKSYSNNFNDQIEKLEQIDRKKHQKKFKEYRLSESSFYGTIEPPNIEIENLISTKNQFKNLEIQIKRRFRQKRHDEFNKIMMQIKRSFKKIPSSSLIKSSKNFEDAPLESIKINQNSILKHSNLNSNFFKTKNKAKFINPLIPLNSKSVHLESSINSNLNTSMSSGKIKNKYKAKKKEEMYIFSRLNRSIEDVSQNNEFTTSNQTFKVLLSTLKNIKYSITMRRQDMLSRLGQNRDRLSSYFEQANILLQQIQKFTAKIIVCNQSALPVGSKYESPEFLRHSLQSEKNGVNFTKLLHQFQILVTSLIEAIRIMLKLPDLKMIISKKSKALSKILPKVMESRYVLNYILKEIDNFELPSLNQRKIFKKRVKLSEIDDKKSLQILWRQAYIKKFQPRFACFR